MSKVVTFGTVPTDIAKNKTIRGVSLALTLVHAILNTAFVAADFDWSQVTLKVTLMRKGQQPHIVCQDNIRNLGCASNFFNPMFLAAKDFTTTLFQLIARGAGAYEVDLASMKVDFGGDIVLRGDDELVAELNLPLGAASATNVNTTTSTLYMDWDLGVGQEYFTPWIKCYTLLAAQQEQSIPMGDNITAVYLLQYDKTNVLTASAVVTTLSLKNNLYTPNKTYNQLLLEQSNSFPTQAEAALRLQSFCLYKNLEHDLDGCSLDLQLNSANVNASKNVVAWYGYKTSPSVFADAVAQASEKQVKTLSKVYGKEKAQAMLK